MKLDPTGKGELDRAAFIRGFLAGDERLHQRRPAPQRPQMPRATTSGGASSRGGKVNRRLVLESNNNSSNSANQAGGMVAARKGWASAAVDVNGKVTAARRRAEVEKFLQKQRQGGKREAHESPRQGRIQNLFSPVAPARLPRPASFTSRTDAAALQAMLTPHHPAPARAWGR